MRTSDDVILFLKSNRIYVFSKNALSLGRDGAEVGVRCRTKNKGKAGRGNVHFQFPSVVNGRSTTKSRISITRYCVCGIPRCKFGGFLAKDRESFSFGGLSSVCVYVLAGRRENKVHGI